MWKMKSMPYIPLYFASSTNQSRLLIVEFTSVVIIQIATKSNSNSKHIPSNYDTLNKILATNNTFYKKMSLLHIADHT